MIEKMREKYREKIAIKVGLEFGVHEVEMRRGRKLKPQDIVEVEGQKIKVV